MIIFFDQILPLLAEALRECGEDLKKIGPMVVNRDLAGRVRLVVHEQVQDNREARAILEGISRILAEKLGPHGVSADRMVLFEPSLDAVKQGAPQFQLQDFDGVTVVDRLATDTDWANIAPISVGPPRLVFFSIKGGVGRSTALAVAAWSLAQAGKRVLVLDLDLESPGLSSSLLPSERRPAHGITDWLVEDLVDNGADVFRDMVGISDLARDGEIFVAPAHGRDPGEYVAKLGRVWMSKTHDDGSREPWSRRLNRLLDELEAHWKPDVVLIDSRAGIDEVASACVTDLGAASVLMFALDGEQTWSGYGILFRHWNQTGVAREIRDRLQVVGSMIPEVNGAEYFAGLRVGAWEAFMDALYDEVPPGEPVGNRFSYDEPDVAAPHFPWPIHWHRGFAALYSLYSRLPQIDEGRSREVFGVFLEGVHALVEGRIA